MSAPAAPPPGVTRAEVARGAGLAGLARLGAAVEALAQPLYTWLFGLATYGIYVVLWGAISLAASVVGLAMTGALQRIVPTAADETEAHGAIKFALIVTLVPAVAVAAAVSLHAEAVASIFAAAPEDRAQLPGAIRLFVWGLPLWTLVEVATAAARARRAFGPEIRLRIFWEQIARLGFALGFFAIGLRSTALMAAHLASLVLVAGLCVPLLGRYYDLKLLARAPIPGALRRDLLVTGFALLPATWARRLLIDAPPLLLNLMLPGASGATAAALFEIGRKISTIPLIVRQAFLYVMRPLSAAQAHADRAMLSPLYLFATRVSAALVIPLAGLLVFGGTDILSLYRPEAEAALPILIILVAGRALEALVGPATPIVEMTGHRALPVINSIAGVALWVLLAWLLVPRMGALGMAVAVAAGAIVISAAAVLELRITERLSPFDARLLACIAIALAGLGGMAAAAALLGGPARFAALLLLWAGTSWLGLRFGLVAEDRAALGGLARRLRLTA